MACNGISNTTCRKHVRPTVAQTTHRTTHALRLAGSGGCHCGFDDDYNQVLARGEFLHECDTPCPGNSNLACGRGDRVQIYTRSPPPTPPLPGGWSTVSACSVDDASRVLEGHRLFSLPVNSPASCTSWCEHTTYSENGVNKVYTWAGVENGDECICGTGWKGGIEPPSAPTYDCATACPEGHMYISPPFLSKEASSLWCYPLNLTLIFLSPILIMYRAIHIDTTQASPKSQPSLPSRRTALLYLI